MRDVNFDRSPVGDMRNASFRYGKGCPKASYGRGTGALKTGTGKGIWRNMFRSQGSGRAVDMLIAKLSG